MKLVLAEAASLTISNADFGLWYKVVTHLQVTAIPGSDLVCIVDVLSECRVYSMFMAQY